VSGIGHNLSAAGHAGAYISGISTSEMKPVPMKAMVKAKVSNFSMSLFPEP
jgi:hypothetical protein